MGISDDSARWKGKNGIEYEQMAPFQEASMIQLARILTRSLSPGFLLAQAEAHKFRSWLSIVHTRPALREFERHCSARAVWKHKRWIELARRSSGMGAYGS